MSNINYPNLILTRNFRDQLLAYSDKYLLSDYPITSSNLILIKDYRQQLRNYMDIQEIVNYNYSSNIPLPELPQFPF